MGLIAALIILVIIYVALAALGNGMQNTVLYSQIRDGICNCPET